MNGVSHLSSWCDGSSVLIIFAQESSWFGSISSDSYISVYLANPVKVGKGQSSGPRSKCMLSYVTE